MHSPIYRARDGKFLGVCQGIARYRDIPVHILRLGLVLFTLFSGFWLGLAIYIVAALMLKPEPLPSGGSTAGPYGSGSYGQSGQSGNTAYTSHPEPAPARQTALALLRDRLQRITTRVQVLEDRVTREEYSWERRLRTPPQ